MKSMSKIGFALVLASATLAVSEAQAWEAPTGCTHLVPPSGPSLDCTSPTPLEPLSGAPLSGWQSGVKIGASVVKRICYSTAVTDPTLTPAEAQTLFKIAVTTQLPAFVSASLVPPPGPPLSTYTKCRAQGLLDAAPCSMANCPYIRRPECAFDGYDWGNIAGTLYCDLSIAYLGLADPGDFPHKPQGTCAKNFELLCPIAYNWVSWYADIPAAPPDTDPPWPLSIWAWPPYKDTQVPGCQPYVQTIWETTYLNSRNYDCVYEF